MEDRQRLLAGRINYKIMWRRKKKQKEVFDRLFIISSVAAFILIFFLFFGLKFIFLNFNSAKVGEEKEKNKVDNTDYSAVSQVKVKDPFITKNPNITDDTLIKPILGNPLDPSLGEEKAELIIVEFSSFTCQFCQNQEKVIREVMVEYGDKICLVWKNYPNNPSGISLQAAVAGHCAHEQGKFWVYHDLLFDRSNDLESDLFLKLAKKIDLDEEAFQSCLNNEASFERIMENIREGDSLRIIGVPFFFVGSQEILGEINKEDLKRIIEIELYGD